MTKDRGKALCDISQLTTDAAAARLAQAQHKYHALAAALAGLEQDPSQAVMAEPAMAQRHFAYERWVAHRREALQHELQQQFEECSGRRQALRQVLMRHQVICRSFGKGA